MTTQEEAVAAVQAYFAGNSTKEIATGVVSSYIAGNAGKAPIHVSQSDPDMLASMHTWLQAGTTTFDTHGRPTGYEINGQRYIIDVVDWDSQFIPTTPTTPTTPTPATTPITNAVTTLKASIPTTVFLPIVAIILIIIFLIRALRK